VTTQTDVNGLICDVKLPATPLGGDMTVGQNPQLEPTVRVTDKEFISNTTANLNDDGRQSDAVSMHDTAVRLIK